MPRNDVDPFVAQEHKRRRLRDLDDLINDAEERLVQARRTVRFFEERRAKLVAQRSLAEISAAHSFVPRD